MSTANPLDFQPMFSQPQSAVAADSECSACGQAIAATSALYDSRGQIVCDACDVQGKISTTERESAGRYALGTLVGGLLTVPLGLLTPPFSISTLGFMGWLGGLYAANRAASRRLESPRTRQALGPQWRQQVVVNHVGLGLGGVGLMLFLAKGLVLAWILGIGS